MTLIETLGSFAAGVRYEDLPPMVRNSTKEHLLDTVGVSLGAVPLATSQMALHLAGPPAKEASIIGFGRRCSASGAAFVNGVLAHSLDFDDTHLPSVLHPSASIVPAALASAESSSTDARALIAAAAAGYEICIRLGMAAYDRGAGNSIFFERGWHATSICGAVASAGVAAKLQGMGAAGIGNALGIAVSYASGVLEANRTGGSVKRLHCGWAAQAGLAAASAARVGFTAPKSALEGKFGFYAAFCGGHLVTEAIVDGLGEDWSVKDIFYKPYPANHFTHAIIDACLLLRPQVNLDDIESIEVRVASPTLRTIAEPIEAKLKPESGYHAQFSAPFAVAAALIGGGGLGVWLDDFTDQKVKDNRYLKLASKVRCVGDPACDAIFPNQFPAIVQVQTKSGKVLQESVLQNRGGPANPLSTEDLTRKFLANAGRVLDTGKARALADAVLNMEEIPIATLMELSWVSKDAPSAGAYGH